MYKKLKNFYNGKKILIIGHTGFKGSWLSASLSQFNAKLYGISNGIVSKPSNYEVSGIKNIIKSYYFDIRNYKKFKSTINLINPDIIFHLAAQSLVRESYNNPYNTWTTNVVGTLNLLEILKTIKLRKKIKILIVTSDKCYKNINKIQGYKENDILGGYEPYGASKASTELLFHSYFQSFFKNNKFINLCTARAGNVIGGGDWSKDRIIPDLIKIYKKNKKLKIRYPNATRPWQHVLEPIFGYIHLGYMMEKKSNKINGQSYNFGPYYHKNYSVKKLLNEIKIYLPKIKTSYKLSNSKFYEAGLLNLNSRKAFKVLNWKNNLNFKESVKLTADWYRNYFKKSNMKKITLEQINFYKNKLI